MLSQSGVFVTFLDLPSHKGGKMNVSLCKTPSIFSIPMHTSPILPQPHAYPPLFYLSPMDTLPNSTSAPCCPPFSTSTPCMPSPYSTSTPMHTLLFYLNPMHTLPHTTSAPCMHSPVLPQPHACPPLFYLNPIVHALPILPQPHACPPLFYLNLMHTLPNLPPCHNSISVYACIPMLLLLMLPNPVGHMYQLRLSNLISLYEIYEFLRLY